MPPRSANAGIPRTPQGAENGMMNGCRVGMAAAAGQNGQGCADDSGLPTHGGKADQPGSKAQTCGQDDPDRSDAVHVKECLLDCIVSCRFAE
jgi:hypothetical protein